MNLRMRLELELYFEFKLCLNSGRAESFTPSNSLFRCDPSDPPASGTPLIKEDREIDADNW